jgi:branched-chain amino acid transport system substrate-binding protein
MLNMIKLAIKDKNLTVDLIAEDGQCDGKAAVNSIQKLISANVNLIIGGTCSGETLAISPIVEQNKTLLLSPSSTAPSISESGNYIFRIIPSDVYQAKIAAKISKEEFNAKRIAIISCPKDFCQSLKLEYMKNNSENIILNESFLENDNDFRTVILKTIDKKIDLIYLLGYESNYTVFLKQYRELNGTAPILAADTINHPDVFNGENMKNYPVRILFPFPKNMYANTFAAKQYLDTYKEDFTPYAPYAYDALNLILNAIQQTNSTDPTVIKDYFYKMPVYHGITGDIQFDSKGDLVGAQYELHEIVNGQDKIIGDIN